MKNFKKYFIKKSKQYLLKTFSILLIPLSLWVCLAGLEFLLVNTSLFDEEDNPKPVYIPEKFRAINLDINAKNHQMAAELNNKYYFNDIPRQYIKEEGIIRIAILGDSFIWGDGVPYDIVWSHKLERKFLQQYENFEILSWGQNGWATKNQLKFLKMEGVKYDIDLLIIGFVTNDPVFRRDIPPRKHFQWQNSQILKPIKRTFPNSINFISSYTNRFLEMYFFDDYGYASWEDRLYSEENLKGYKKILSELYSFCQTKNIKLLVVLTPNDYDKHFRRKYDKIIPILKKIGIHYLDLYPIIYRELKSYNKRELWANIANGHPGDIVTSIYANEVFDYITQRQTKKFFHKNIVLSDSKIQSTYINGKDFLSGILPSVAKKQFKLGFLYYTGRGSVGRDFAKAAYWYRKAAEQGNAEAQYFLGLMYYRGQGISQDFTKAAYWYRKAAKQGNAKAQYPLGKMYYLGRGVSRNFVLATQWYSKAAEQGIIDAQYVTGVMYYRGQGVSKNFIQAAQWYRKAAEQGKVEAQFDLIKMYYNGRISKDFIETEWFPKVAQRYKGYRKIAERGDAFAQYVLGQMYYFQAAQWYHKAAEQGNTKAQDQLRLMCDNNINHLFQNRYWCSKAVKQGTNVQH